MKMKKLLWMMSIAMLMASCSNDDLESVVSNGNEAQVSFTVALNRTPDSRAISDGTTVNELYYEVYDKDGNKLEISGKKENAFTDLKETVNITLAKGQTYTFAFWAQKEDAYVAENLQCVELNYESVVGNNEDRDAFFACTKPIAVTDNFEHEVTLTRPFAQLNLAVSDLTDFQKAGVNLDQVEVTVSEVAAKFDVTTGKVSEEVSNVEFTLADVLCNGTENKTLRLNNPVIINGERKTDFDWVSMNYLLVNDETTGAASSNVDVKFTIKTDKDDVVLTSTGTTVQRNYRTNLIARLTNEGTFNIIIDKEYNADYTFIADGVAVDVAGNIAIYNAAGMFWFANEVNVNKNNFSGKTVELANDIDLENKLWEPIGQTGATEFYGTFDGNNYTIRNLNIKNESVSKNCTSGLFGWIERHSKDEADLMAVKNLKVDGAVVEGHHNCGVIVGYLGSIVDNCNVTCATVTCTHENDDGCGDKAGVIAGIAGNEHAEIRNCIAENSTVTASRDAGQIVGAFTTKPIKVIDCSAENVKVCWTGDCTGDNINSELIGRTE